MLGILGQTKLACLMLVSYMTLALAASSNALEGAVSAVSKHSKLFLRHAKALVHHCLRHDNLQGALTPAAQELSMQCRQVLDDAAAARARAPMRDRITGADAVHAVAATSTRASRMQLISATQALRLLASVLQYASYYFLPVSPRVERKLGT